MYSMVMMVAMTASPEAAAFGNGCGGCGGGLFSGLGCGGGLFHGGCKGCSGGMFLGGKGCGGGVFNGGCNGCGGGGLFHGGCKGCNGGMFLGGCHGCNGGMIFGGKGCCGGGLFSGMFHGKGCTGGCTGAGCVGASCHGGCGGTVVTPEKKEMPKPKEEKKGGVTAAPAYIAVNVPADATITIDGAPTKSTSTTRMFSTPELSPGTVYYYTLVAEVVRDGQKFVAVEKVAVEAGATVEVSLNPGTVEVSTK